MLRFVNRMNRLKTTPRTCRERASWAGAVLVALAIASGCAPTSAQARARSAQPPLRVVDRTPRPVRAEPAHEVEATPPPARPAPPAPAPTEAEVKAKGYAEWVRHKLPPGGQLLVNEGEPPRIVHTASKGDTLATIAAAYIDLTDVYLLNELAEDIGKTNPKSRYSIKPGAELEIPHILRAPYKTGDAERLGWPEDGVIRGIYVRGDTAGGRSYVSILNHMAERGMNAIVLDTKDTDGYLTYKSKVPLAVETNATKTAAIRDLPRAIRFAHERGVRVIMRISCFHDEWIQPRKTALSVRGKWGGPYPIGWLDPSSEGAHEYIIALAKEAMDAGADEIQLDYVRYPVIGTKNADFHLKERNLTRVEVIRDFVREVHEVTRARGVPLSLDVFGVIALGKRIDIDALGQDLALLGPECEALSPMVYPSHYAKGFYGFEEPGNHPELIAIGTKGTIEQLTAANVTKTKVRPWLQAFYWESPEYGPEYLRAEMMHAGKAGGSGWLLWNPGQDYSFAWQVVPKVAPAPPEKKADPVSARPARHLHRRDRERREKHAVRVGQALAKR
jgi:hypothetical protein